MNIARNWRFLYVKHWNTITSKGYISTTRMF